MMWRRFGGGPSAARSHRPPHLDQEAAQGSYSLQRAEAVAHVMSLWERRLRGYDLFESPVALEPAFLPFHLPLLCDEETWQDLEGEPQRDGPLAFARVLVPAEQKVAPDAMGALLGAWSTLSHPVALEIVATEASIIFQIACAKGEEAFVEESLCLAFPLAQSAGANDNAIATHGEVAPDFQGDALHDALSHIGSPSPHYWVVDLGLGRAAYEPLGSLSRWAPDPLLALVGVLGSLERGEVAGFQMLCSPARNPWGAELGQLVALWRDWGGKDEPDARTRKMRGQEMEKALRSKLAAPLWVAAPRVFAASADGDTRRTLDLCGRLAAALPGADMLLALDDEGYGRRDHLLDVLARRSRRCGLLISAQELATLWHPPAETLAHPRLLRTPPPALPSELKGLPGVRLGRLGDKLGGESSEQKGPLVLWPDAWRTRHFYALGATRMGKSTLLLNMIAQDLAAGRGLCLIDPHGDLARDVLSLVPPEREKDVLFLDLADAAFPPALGLLDARDEWEERLLVSDLLSILRRLFASSWGDRLEHLLRHALLTLLADKRHKHTLREVRPLLSDEAFRAHVLTGIKDPDLRLFWARELPAYPASALSPIYNKLGLLFSSPLVRNIAGGSASKLHFGELMREKKVLLVDLSAGKIGQDNAHFLGALLVSRLQLSAMHTLRLGRQERTNFTLYVDEFHAFIVSSFETILSEAGKAGLEMVMANQFLEQLDQGLQTAILSNVGTLVSFRVSAATAHGLEREFGGVVEAEALVDLSRGEAVARLGRAGNTVRLNTFGPPPLLEAAQQAQRIERITKRTREQLCRPRAEVEAEIFGAAMRSQSGFSQTGELEERTVGDATPGLETDAPQELLRSSPSPSLSSTGPSRFGWDDEDAG
jgi:hypothetical protein